MDKYCYLKSILLILLVSQSISFEADKAVLAPGTHTFELSLNELLSPTVASQYNSTVSIADPQRWQVYAPDNDSGKPPGLFVYVSPVRSGQIPQDWKRVMDSHNLVYISADNSSNYQSPNKRIILAVNAVALAMKHWPFDPGRVIISGFSGGGRMASILATRYPEIFSGALYICGVNFWPDKAVPDLKALSNKRFVFFSGTNDFNLGETRQVHEQYLQAGLVHSKLLVAPRTSHELPDARYLNLAISYLVDRPDS
jgi:predicted esterase